MNNVYYAVCSIIFICGIYNDRIKRILFFRRRMNLVDIEEVTVSEDFSSEEKYERSPELV
jgi:hypothetical protein